MTTKRRRTRPPGKKKFKAPPGPEHYDILRKAFYERDFDAAADLIGCDPTILKGWFYKDVTAAKAALNAIGPIAYGRVAVIMSKS